MMDFASFARANGLLIRDVRADGRIHRCPTVEKPRKRNGAYRFDGEWGWCQSWDTMTEPAIFKPDNRPIAPQPRRRAPAMDEQAARRRAAEQAAEIVRRCQYGEHPYLARKGFPAAQGLIDEAGRLVIPMRSVGAYARIQSLQWIDAEGAKKFLPGGQAKGGVFRIGSGDDTWLCEGYATGLSLAAALRSLYWPAAVVVCFSAGNLRHVAHVLPGRRYVMADNDASQTGERAASGTGLPWVMPAAVGTDANDLHVGHGVRALAELMRGVR